MDNRLKFRTDTFCYALLSGALLLFVAAYLSQPITDYDFWWHLKSGEVIAQTRALFFADPFNFSGDPAVVTMRERTTLNGYWLWQVMAYGFYSLGGFAGIKLLNALTLAGIYAVLVGFFRHNQVRLPLALLLIAASLTIFRGLFFLERPQVFSFLFAALLIGWFVNIRRGERPSPWLFPVMIVWGNLHGGFLIGVMLLGLFCLGSLWDFRRDPEHLRRIIWWCLGGIATAHLNPNGLYTYLGVWKSLGAGVTAGIAEYRSTWAVIGEYNQVFLLWALILLHFWTLSKRPNACSYADWLISLFLAFLGVLHLRNIAFVAVSLLPMTGYLLEVTCTSGNAIIKRFGRVVFLAGGGAFLIYTLFSLQQVYGARQRGDWGELSRTYPQGLANFLLSVPLRGNIYNEYTWGGFLVWKLYPEYKLFIDGRGLYPQVKKDYDKISSASLEKIDGKYEYEVLLDKYNINIVAANIEINFKSLNTLLKFLLAKPDWYPIYLDDMSYVLVKKSANNADVIRNYGINKLVFLNKVLALYTNALEKQPRDATRYLGRGELLGYMGRYAEAERDFAMVRQLDPDNPLLSAKLKQLEGLRNPARSVQESPAR